MELEPRDIDLLLNGADSLASSWRLRQLKARLRKHPEMKAVAERYRGSKHQASNPQTGD